MIHTDEIELENSTHKLRGDSLSEFQYNYNISPSKYQSIKKREKSITSISPRYRNGISSGSGSGGGGFQSSHPSPSEMNGPEIFSFELGDEEARKEFVLRKAISKKRNRESRIRAKLVIDDLLVLTPDWAICSVCNEVFKKPVVTPECGHTYCFQCIEKVCNSKSRECPLCRKPIPLDIDVKELSPNLQLLHVIDTLKVRCRWGMKLSDGQWVHDPEGCQEITEWQSLFAHDEVCGFVHVPCSYKNCSMLVQRRELEHHNATCEERVISCDLCNVTYPFKNTAEHQKKCPKFQSYCPKGCGQLIANQFRKIHLQNECPEIELSCVYSCMGCSYKAKKKQVDEHLKSCIYHALKPFILQTQVTLSDLLKTQQQHLETITTQQKEINYLKQLVDQQEQELNRLKAKSNESSPQTVSNPVPIPIDSPSRYFTGGLWNRLYRIIDPRDDKPESPLVRGSIHS